jgi:hypothetical protein
MRRVYQRKRWNADPAHQSLAGHASFDACSARWRASSGLAPLSAEATKKYVTPDMIRGVIGLFLPTYLQAVVHRAWCAGMLLPITAWLGDDPPPEPEALWRIGAAGAATDEADKARQAGIQLARAWTAGDDLPTGASQWTRGCRRAASPERVRRTPDSSLYEEKQDQ